MMAVWGEGALPLASLQCRFLFSKIKTKREKEIKRPVYPASEVLVPMRPRSRRDRAGNPLLITCAGSRAPVNLVPIVVTGKGQLGVVATLSTKVAFGEKAKAPCSTPDAVEIGGRECFLGPSSARPGS